MNPPCPNLGWFDFDLKECQDTCPTFKFRENKNRICYLACPPKTYSTVNANNGEKLCVSSCPTNFFINEQLACEVCRGQCNNLM